MQLAAAAAAAVKGSCVLPQPTHWPCASRLHPPLPSGQKTGWTAALSAAGGVPKRITRHRQNSWPQYHEGTEKFFIVLYGFDGET